MPEVTEAPAEVEPLWKQKHDAKVARMKRHFGPVASGCLGPAYSDADVNTQGLTKLEHASIQLLAGMLANPNNSDQLHHELKSEAISLARQLLSELNAPK